MLLFQFFFENRVIYLLIQFIIPKALQFELQNMINRKQILRLLSDRAIPDIS